MRPLLLLTVLAMTGCVIGQDKYPRPRDLAPSWLVDKPRILGIQAEPPEVRPGEFVRFYALLPDPQEIIETKVWIVCDPGTASGFGCSLDLSVLEMEDPSFQDLQDAGVIGIEPLFPPFYQPDQAMLDGLEGMDLLEGVQVTVNLLAMPGTNAGSTIDEIDFDEVETGYKRLVVSEATTPNKNPVASTFIVDGVEIPPQAIVEVEPGHIYEPGVVVDVETIESYEFLNSQGEVEDRVEEPYITWYTTGGTNGEAYSLLPCDQEECILEGTWTAPEESGEAGTWYAVLRDRRGGMSWIERAWIVR